MTPREQSREQQGAASPRPRPSPVPRAGETSGASRTGTARLPLQLPSRRATVLSALTAVLVLAAGFTIVAAVRVSALPGDNAAVTDQAATTEVATQVSDGVKAIFSYDYANLPRTERAAASVLVDAAVAQYQSGYPQAKQQAADQKLVRTTSVSSIGVQDLRGDTAHLLLFLDQQTLVTTSNQQSSASAALAVTARRMDGSWKIASLNAL